MGMHRHLGEIGKISDLESRLSRYQLLVCRCYAIPIPSLLTLAHALVLQPLANRF
jgi:hypothetical protein